MGHKMTHNIMDSHSYLDNCGNSGANTCVLAATHGAVLLLDQNQTASSRPPGDSE